MNMKTAITAVSRALPLTAIVVFMSGCASNSLLRPVPAPDQSSRYERGTPVVVSAKRNVVAVQPQSASYKSNERPGFVVTVQNGTEAPFEFSSESVRATVDGAPVRVMSYEELVKEVENRRILASVGAALAGAAGAYSASQAGYQYNYGTTQTNIYSANRGYVGSASGSYSGYTYNPAVAAQAQAASNAQTRETMETITANANHALASIGQTALRRQTILPGQWFGGIAKVDGVPAPNPENKIRVVIELPNEVHEFTFVNAQAK